MNRNQMPTDIILQAQQALMSHPGFSSAGMGSHGAFGSTPANTAGGGGQQSLWKLVDDRLRGRWVLMLAAGAGLALVLSVMGFLSTQPTYRSEGAIRIAPHIAPVIGEMPEHDLRNYFGFMATQVQYVLSRRVIEHALEQEQLKQLGWSQHAGAIRRIERGLEADAARNTELIVVSYEADDPKIAQAVCAAVIQSYDKIYGSAGGTEIGLTLQKLYDLKSRLDRDHKSARAAEQMIVARHQATDLEQLHITKSMSVDSLGQKIMAAERALERSSRLDHTAADGTHRVSGAALQLLESVNPALADARALRDTARLRFQQMGARYPDTSPQYVRFRDEAENAERVFQQHYVQALEEWSLNGIETLPGDALESFFLSLSPERLREEIGRLRTRLASMTQESRDLLADIQQLSDKRFEAESVQQELDRVVTRIERLELEAESLSGRIRIVQEATTPLGPTSDGRKKRAAAGFVAGFSLSFAAFFLIGTVDRRTYGVIQLATDGTEMPPCLGVLPDLGRAGGVVGADDSSATDPEAGDIASHCVHQIRNQIEVLREQNPGGYVLNVTSPFQGDGKTSIAMALGWSYAAAGYSTLLIDCDLVGRNLTRQLGMIGREGLKEAIASRSLDSTVQKLPVENLSLLPVGVDARYGPETIRQIDLQRIFDQARERYEMIIVDTGPVLGSLESTPVTAAADGVVLSLRRGRSRTRLEECIRRLKASGANCIGVILNCVDRSECSRYVSEASIEAADIERQSMGEEGTFTVLRTSSVDRNALMQAMETTARHREDHEDGGYRASA